MPRTALATLSLLAVTLLVLAADPVAPRGPAEASWWKGNTHTHTLWSDGDAAPELVVRWYRDHGYDFLALTEHNVLARGERWVAIKDDGPVTPFRVGNLRTAFGEAWVQTRSRPDTGDEMRLRTLDELRALTGREYLDEVFRTLVSSAGAATEAEVQIRP